MAKFVYKNIKNGNTHQMFLKLNYGYKFYILFEKKDNF